MSVEEEKKRLFTNSFLCSAEILEKFLPTTRDDDIFTATVPKCGQTWTTTLLFHLKTKAKYPDLKGNGIMGVVPWLEIPMNLKDEGGIFSPYDVETRLEELASFESPRLFKMHVIWDDIPRELDSKSKVITITRDPRDIPYSFYKHMDAMSHHNIVPKRESFEEYFEKDYMKEFFISQWVNSFWPHRNDPNLLWLRYEDLKEDLKASAIKIVQFLEWDNTEEEIDEAVRLCSFANMKKSEKEVIFAQRSQMFRKDSSFIREGKVGENRKHLSVDMEEIMLERLKSEIPEDAYKFLLPDL